MTASWRSAHPHDVQQAVRLAIEPIFEATFCDGSYGFRPGRGCHGALRAVATLLEEGHTFVVDADLQSYFDTIPHDRLMARVEELVSDGVVPEARFQRDVLDLIRQWLKAGIMAGTETWTPEEGTPQGSVVSPLLANIYLDPLDRLMAERGYRIVAKRASARRAVRGRLRRPVPDARGRGCCPGPDPGLGSRERPHAAPDEDTHW